MHRLGNLIRCLADRTWVAAPDRTGVWQAYWQTWRRGFRHPDRPALISLVMRSGIREIDR
jgi:hypothetical protein